MKARMRAPNFRKRLIKKNLLKADFPCEEDSEPPSIPTDEGNHVNWAEDLEKVIDIEDFKDAPLCKKSTSENVCCKSILKKTKSHDGSHLSETECSSTCSDASHLFDSGKRVPFFGSGDLEAVTEAETVKPLPSYKYPNKKLLLEILSKKKKRTLSFHVASKHTKLSDKGD